MSWSIYCTGTRDKVLERVKAYTPQHLVGCELEEFRAAQKLIMNRVVMIALPAVAKNEWEPNAIKVEANGHGCDTSGSLTVNITAIKLEI